MLMARTASCRLANAFLDQIKANLAEIQPENCQNVQKTCFLQKAPGVNGLVHSLKRPQHLGLTNECRKNMLIPSLQL